MRSSPLFFICIACVIFSLTQATEVNDCITDEEYTNAQVNITKCNSPPCLLKRRTKVGVEIKLKPDHKVERLENNVYALIVGVPFPFVGVDGTDACTNVFNEDGTKAGCPLEAGKQYIYKNSFDILNIYPKIKVNVQWALKEQKTGKDVHCFRVQSKIVS